MNALYTLAIAAAWKVKEQTCRRQVEAMLRELRAGRTAALSFAPVHTDDVAVIYDAMLSASAVVAPDLSGQTH